MIAAFDRRPRRRIVQLGARASGEGYEQIDFNTATLHVRRVKKGSPSTHPILGDELRALRRLAREQDPKSPFVFTSERGAPFTTAGFARMVERAGAVAELGFKAHPHMLRHACGFALANKTRRRSESGSNRLAVPLVKFRHKM